jgi:ubiquinone/menaquinone biosynthesis C-methylase UbiE
MRSLADYQRGLLRDGPRPYARRPRGLSRDRTAQQPQGRLIGRWFDYIVPLIGRLVGQGSAYAYLVQSTRDYPAPEDVAVYMRAAGLRDVDWFGLSGGIVTIHVGTVVGAGSPGGA